MTESRRQPALAVLAASPADLAPAAALGGRLGLSLLALNSDPAHCSDLDAILVVSGDRLQLQRAGRGAPGPVSVDFGSSAMRHRRRAGHNELLGRAVGVGKKPGLRILDATAGLGRDGFVLADLGCQVFLCEREPVIVEMLRAGMQAANAGGDEWLCQVLGRMHLLPGDARDLGERLPPVDVIYLDPMFPGRGKSAAVKKEMVLFQLLLGSGEGCGDGDELLLWAMASGVPRVVVKRPPGAPPLGGRRASHSLSGKAVRYDVYQRSKPG